MRGEALYTGNVDCIRQIVAADGVLGLWRGHTIMCAREALAFGTYFSTYEFVKAGLGQAGLSGASAQMAAGATTGAVTWFVVCPLDVIKSRVQTAMPLPRPLAAGERKPHATAQQVAADLFAESKARGSRPWYEWGPFSAVLLSCCLVCSPSLACHCMLRVMFYRGVGPAMARGIPTNAVLFLTYETIVANWRIQGEGLT